jgi:hypothetical protein
MKEIHLETNRMHFSRRDERRKEEVKEIIILPLATGHNTTQHHATTSRNNITQQHHAITSRNNITQQHHATTSRNNITQQHATSRNITQQHHATPHRVCIITPANSVVRERKRDGGWGHACESL